ncbi:MAG: hypothetical protein LUI06_03540 [Ruminococcus sp.]|nr:hypothetical protein [Ruminococcus sp.]
MKIKQCTAALFAVILSFSSVTAFADYDASTSYTTDTQETEYDTYSDSTTYLYDLSSDDSESYDPATISVDIGKIEDNRFTAQLLITSPNLVTAADLTINYDDEVLDLLSQQVNESAGGTAVAAETEDGVLQYQYANAYGSDWEESYLTMEFEIIDTSERSSVIYISVNSLLDDSQNELTYRSDGSIVQIAGAVEVDAAGDASMYTELKVTKSETAYLFESLGIYDAASVTIEDGEYATADETSITTLSSGITNVMVEFNDGTVGYYRLVISEPETQSEEYVEAAVTIDEDGDITKTESNSSQRKKYLIIYLLVIAAVIAIIIEFFYFFGNPYAKTARLLKERRSKLNNDEPNAFDDDMFPERQTYDEEDDDYSDLLERKVEAQDNNSNQKSQEEPLDYQSNDNDAQ